jgi:hypothetical protein
MAIAGTSRMVSSSWAMRGEIRGSGLVRGARRGWVAALARSNRWLVSASLSCSARTRANSTPSETPAQVAAFHAGVLVRRGTVGELGHVFPSEAGDAPLAAERDDAGLLRGEACAQRGEELLYLVPVVHDVDGSPGGVGTGSPCCSLPRRIRSSFGLPSPEASAAGPRDNVRGSHPWLAGAYRRSMNTNTITLNNGVTLPAIGLGVFQTPPDETRSAVEAALSVGYRHIDTAAAYFNEKEVGEGLANSDVDRAEIFVETKIWITDYGYDETAQFRQERRQARPRPARPASPAPAPVEQVREDAGVLPSAGEAAP